MSHHQRARRLFQKGQHEQSVHHFLMHISSHPDDARAHHDLSAPLYAMGDLERAEKAATTATKLDEKNPENWSTLATIQAARGQIGTPLRSILRATKLEPDNAKYRLRLGSLLLDQGHLEHAIKNYDLILSKQPENLNAISGKAAVLERQGKTEEAYTLLKPIIPNAPANSQLGTTWGTVCRRLKKSDLAIDVLIRMLNKPMNDAATSMLLAELGALYDAVGQHDAAFAAYTEANARRNGNFDPSQFEAHIDRLMTTFNEDCFSHLPRGQNTTNLPILIVGMPRSGTSLVEQILSAHHDVFGAGELEDLRASSLLGEQMTGTRFPEWISNANHETINALGEWYLDRRQKQANGALWVTDKMPQNFQMLGLAALTIPGVRIVHCVRNPLDTALSCYFQGFKAALAWSNKLEWLGAYLVQYKRIMAHWNSVLPVPIHTIEYERLVSNPEPEIRSLLEHCGIPFDPVCLQHHTSGRQVATASYAQANQPIYRSSLGKSDNYLKQLSPIVAALEGM